MRHTGKFDNFATKDDWHALRGPATNYGASVISQNNVLYNTGKVLTNNKKKAIYSFFCTDKVTSTLQSVYYPPARLKWLITYTDIFVFVAYK